MQEDRCRYSWFNILRLSTFTRVRSRWAGLGVWYAWNTNIRFSVLCFRTRKVILCISSFVLPIYVIYSYPPLTLSLYIYIIYITETLFAPGTNLTGTDDDHFQGSILRFQSSSLIMWFCNSFTLMSSITSCTDTSTQSVSAQFIFDSHYTPHQLSYI